MTNEQKSELLKMLDDPAMVEDCAKAYAPELWAHEDEAADSFDRLNACTVDYARARGQTKRRMTAALSTIKQKLEGEL